MRLWLVDEANSQIWEWRPRERHPVKRSLWAAEQGAGDNDGGLAAERLARAGFPPPGGGGRGGPGGGAAAGGGGAGGGGGTGGAGGGGKRGGAQRPRKPGIAADVARTGVAINIPFPAVQSESFSIEVVPPLGRVE